MEYLVMILLVYYVISYFIMVLLVKENQYYLEGYDLIILLIPIIRLFWFLYRTI